LFKKNSKRKKLLQQKLQSPQKRNLILTQNQKKRNQRKLKKN
jgi:hypothetical protein